jgi:Na+/H+ antiporter NhaD/arsenite permease-like protein
MMRKLIKLWREDTVLVISGILALLSMCVVPPSILYLNYIDIRVLVILFCLMLVVAGMVGLGVFEFLGRSLISKIGSIRSLLFVLVLLCFFLSMFLTNDVALITFVPFSIMILGMSSMKQYMIKLLVLETIAANLGSMLTPIGNPQNLYLYSRFYISIAEFLSIMAPYTAVSLFLLLCCIAFCKREKIKVEEEQYRISISGSRLAVYIVLFLICISTVARILDYRILFCIVFLTVIFTDRNLIKKADYSLLLTFVFFFVFIGNMGQISLIRQVISKAISGREILVSVLASQGISNVPAAVLLSGFTDQYKSLLIGTNIGGLGTLIASMASLISYKYYANTENSDKGKYIGHFSVINAVFLAALLIFNVLINIRIG